MPTIQRQKAVVSHPPWLWEPSVGCGYRDPTWPLESESPRGRTWARVCSTLTGEQRHSQGFDLLKRKLGVSEKLKVVFSGQCEVWRHSLRSEVAEVFVCLFCLVCKGEKCLDPEGQYPESGGGCGRKGFRQGRDAMGSAFRKSSGCRVQTGLGGEGEEPGGPSAVKSQGKMMVA